MKTIQMGPLNSLKQRAAHVALGLGLAATLAFGAVMPASADTGTGTASLQGGENTADILADFGFDDGVTGVGNEGVKLTGRTGQTATAAPSLEVVDASGTTNGWSLTMKMSDVFSDGGGNDFTAAPRVAAPAVSGLTNSITGSVNIKGATEVPVVNVASGVGGTYTFSPTVTIDIPADTLDADYTGTLSITIAPKIT